MCSSLTQVHTCLCRVRAKYVRKIWPLDLLQSGPQLSSFPLLLHCVWNSNYLIPWKYSSWCSLNIYCNVCLEQNIQILLWNGGLLGLKCTRWVSQVDFQPPVVWKLLTSLNRVFTETRGLEKLELQVLKRIHMCLYIFISGSSGENWSFHRSVLLSWELRLTCRCNVLHLLTVSSSKR